MNRRLIQRPEARRDVLDIFVYLRRKSPRTADRFIAAADRAFAQLAARPGIGALYESEDPAFAGIRVSPITRYRSYLIIYRATDDRLEVLRVLHAARDVGGLLDDALGPPEGPG